MYKKIIHHIVEEHFDHPSIVPKHITTGSHHHEVMGTHTTGTHHSTGTHHNV